MSHSIKELCNLAAESFELAVIFINPDGEILFENSSHQNPLYKNEKQNLFKVLEFDPTQGYDFPAFRKSIFSENYLIISYLHNGTFAGNLLLGPSIPYRLPEEQVNGFVNDTQEYFYRQQVLDYYKTIPVVLFDRFIQIGIVTYHLFNKVLLSTETVIGQNKLVNQPNNKEINLLVSENLQKGTFHHNPIHEKTSLAIISEGRVEDLKFFTASMEKEVGGVLSKSSYIRSFKNQIIVMITLVTRAAIDGGLNYETAYTLSDIFIQKLEELNTAGDINRLSEEVLYTFTEQVLQVKNERYSNTVNACKNYIYKHIYEEINPDDLGETLGHSPKYLSLLFKNEVGVSLRDYIHQAKMDEAKKLLAYSHTPISEISSLLNFTDQSHFTKVFRKIAGVTPKYYREKHHLLEK